ncbi:MAG: hypothetical protein QQN62_06645 [Nitrosopumilus sp.]
MNTIYPFGSSSSNGKGIATGQTKSYLERELQERTVGTEIEREEDIDVSLEPFQTPEFVRFHKVTKMLAGSFKPYIKPLSVVTSDIEAQVVIRKHIMEKILIDLQKIQKVTGQPRASVFASEILNSIREMRDKIPFDPFIEVVMALHDAMAFENSWLDYSVEQYQGAYEILRKLVDIKHLQNNKIGKVILELDKLDFKILPFELSYDSVTQGEKD